MTVSPPTTTEPIGRWEIAAITAAILVSLGLGFANLAGPSLWHDEAVQVLVAKSIADTGKALLPSGRVHAVAPVHDAVMATAIYLFGSGEIAVRAPSVVFGALNVLLTFLLVRPLLGRSTALVSAFALALSPWSVAWARQARFYELQQTLYLAAIWLSWKLLEARQGKALAGYALGFAVAYLLGVGTSLHSVLFVVPLGGFAFCMVALDRSEWRRWAVLWAACCAAAAGTMVLYRLTLPEVDAVAIFDHGGIGLQTSGAEHAPLLYYFTWLSGNLGTGFFVLALVGTVMLLISEHRKGLFAVLAFWVPILALSFLLSYRRHRFLYFAYPFYGVLFSYAIVRLAGFAMTARRATWRMALAAVIAVFGARTAWSAVKLVGNSLTVASGDDTTLATRHPQFRKPCLYVREHLQGDEVVLADSVVTALYYVGRVDEWYPNRYFPWEYCEAGSMGLKDPAELEAYMAKHPKGYFICEWYRFWRSDLLRADVDWVNAHMKKIDKACSKDVFVYSWGID